MCCLLDNNLRFFPFLQAPDVDSDLFVELLGIVVNLDIPSFDWPAFIAKHDLLTLLSGKHPPPLHSATPAVTQIPLRPHWHMLIQNSLVQD